jgi:hypothetical protein
MAKIISLMVLVTCAGCTGSSGPTAFGGQGDIGGPARTTSIGTSRGSSTGSAGGNSLDGPLAFTPASSGAARDGGHFTVVISDEPVTSCYLTGRSAQQVRVEISQVDGGLPGLGSYDVDGSHVTVARVDPMGTVAVAASGKVTLNRLDDAALGGNFTGAFVPVDGGPSTALSGIFGATRCP